MPTISKLIVYPIKSIDGVEVDRSQVRPGGSLNYDREFAMFNAEGRTINGKKYPALHQVRADFNLNYHLVTLSAGAQADTFMLYADTARIAEWFADYLGTSVTLRQDTHTGFPDDGERPGPTVVSEASLQTVADWFGLPLAQVRRRFRANIELAGCPPFWEDQLFGPAGTERPFWLGGVQLLGIKPCARCPVPARDPDTGQPDARFQKTFSDQRQATLPAFASLDQFPHFYYLTVNTKIPASEAGKELVVGNELS